MASTVADTARFGDASNVLAGGVSASLRFHPYLHQPLYIANGDGPYIFDTEGTKYIDFNTSNGAAILGHKHPEVRHAVLEGLDAGTIAASETTHHIKLAHTLCELIPSAERVRFASTGSEVTSVAVRLARYATGRTKILKFDGHFHGLTDTFLFKRDSQGGGAVLPSSAGVPERGTEDIVLVPWNSPEDFESAIAAHGHELAAVILEPVHFNAGCIPPVEGFLELIRERTRNTGTILIFDEVLSGFRANLGGMESYFGVRPDLSTWAKALANGMPLSALTGRADLMEQLAPNGPVAHSGTYSGHLLSVLASLATIEQLKQPGRYERLHETSQRFYAQLQDIFDRHQVPARVQGLGLRFGLYFGRRDSVRSVADVVDHNHDLHSQFCLGCLKRGVYFHAYSGTGPPGHAGYSFAHSDDVLANALDVMDSVAAGMAMGGHA